MWLVFRGAFVVAARVLLVREGRAPQRRVRRVLELVVPVRVRAAQAVHVLLQRMLREKPAA